jgi:hypothetical protein
MDILQYGERWSFRKNNLDAFALGADWLIDCFYLILYINQATL